MVLTWGLLGCGDIARKRVAEAILAQPNCRLLAACRRNESELGRFCEQFKIEHAYACDSDLLQDADVQAVYVATPVALHCPQTIAAARAGKHVLVEKPMALSVAECEQMIAACAKAGISLGVAYYRTFYPAVGRIKQLVAEGAIGRVLNVQATAETLLPRPLAGQRPWRLARAQAGGGPLMDIGSHRIQLFLELFGPVAKIKSICSPATGNDEVENRAVIVLRFQNGIIGSLICSFADSGYIDEFRVIGTQGRLEVSPLNSGRLIVVKEGLERIENHPPAANLHEPLIADFVAAIQETRRPRVSGEDGRDVNQVIEQAYKAAGRL